MKNEVFTYLKNHFPQEPKAIDRLIISSFIKKNNITIRNNQLIKDHIISDDHSKEYKQLIKFIEYIEGKTFNFDFETLIEFFEFIISPAEKIVNGAVYTPYIIRQYICNNVLDSVNDSGIKICDPACGCGGFLFTISKKLKGITGLSYKEIYAKNIFGLDIKNYSIVRSKLLLSLLAISEGEDETNFEFNLFRGNALNFNWSNYIKNFQGFDIIVGNPPYVCSRNIDKESKKLLANWIVSSTGHPDLYIPFFQIGLDNLKSYGKLGYITMNSFFKSLNGRALRKYFNDFAYKFNIIDFGSSQVFKSKSTYTCICIIEKQNDSNIKYARLNNVNELNQKLYYENIAYSTLDSYNGWNLKNVSIIKQIEETGIPFGKLYTTRNGIATLKNNIYIFNPIDEDKDYYYLKNGGVFQIEKEVCLNIINPNKLTKENNIDSLKKKIIFPYYFNSFNKAQIISQKEFQKNYPMTFKYLYEKKKLLEKRDKGNGKYEQWYAYGRNQSLERYSYKLFFPHITPKTPNFLLSTDDRLLFYNGIAVVSGDLNELQFLKKLMSSRLFWFYIVNSSKPYGSGFYSLSRNYIKNFGVYSFNEKEKNYLIHERDKKKINAFIEAKYKVKL